jgi:DNA-binding NarL/FixJ family response regulator
MASRYRLVIAEDHTILREGLRSLLATEPLFEIVAEACDGLEAVSMVGRHRPDLILMDVSMPRMNGIEAAREIARQYPQTKILILTVHDGEDYVLSALEAGAAGYVLKDSTRAELIDAARKTLEGKSFLSPEISRKVIDGYLEGRKGIKGATNWDTLTHREREVLKLIAEGRTNKSIGDLLCISSKTVEKHRTNLMRKLDLHNVSEVTVFAVRKGLIER